MVLGLEGIKVIQTATVMAGPMAARLLADWGADVIKIEHPIRGSMFRNQITSMVGGGCPETDINFTLENTERNKRSITLDLSKEGGREIIHKLLETADVFVSNFRPRELEKFSLQYETVSKLNPRLVFANISGYGTKGPNRDLPGYEGISYFSRGGVLHVLQFPGMPPNQYPLGFGDYPTGMCLAYGIMLALFIRERTGVGQEVDASLFNTAVFGLSHHIAATLVARQDWQKVERKDVDNPLAGFYLAKDGKWVRIGIVQPDLYWSRFCKAIEREDLEHDPRFESFEPRIENHAALFTILEQEVFPSKTYDEWSVRLTEAGLPWGPVQSLLDVINDPQAKANDFFVPLNHPTHGRMEVVANPIKLNKTPPTKVRPAPEFSQHTEEVLLEYGYTWENIVQFKEQGVIA